MSTTIFLFICKERVYYKMSGIIGGVINFNNKSVSKEVKNNMIRTINSYKVDDTNYILKNNYLMHLMNLPV